VRQFQQLMQAALVAGTIAGTLLFVYQYLVLVPQIVAAEAYESHEEGAVAGGGPHAHSEWKPSEGWERSLFTAASTI
jgi:predicted cobalt transporter CbtA